MKMITVGGMSEQWLAVSIHSKSVMSSLTPTSQLGPAWTPCA